MVRTGELITCEQNDIFSRLYFLDSLIHAVEKRIDGCEMQLSLH